MIQNIFYVHHILLDQLENYHDVILVHASFLPFYEGTITSMAHWKVTNAFWAYIAFSKRSAFMHTFHGCRFPVNFSNYICQYLKIPCNVENIVVLPKEAMHLSIISSGY